MNARAGLDRSGGSDNGRSGPAWRPARETPIAPLSYDLDAALGRLHVRCSGPLTLDEVLAFFRALEREEILPRRLDVLADVRATESLPDTEDVRIAALEIRQLALGARWGACAVVADRDAAYGVARMFLMLADRVFGATSVFRDVDSAELWLAAQKGMGG